MGTAPDAVKRLVDHFDQNRKVFQSPDYKEEQLRAELLNPLSPHLAGISMTPLTRFGPETGEVSLFPRHWRTNGRRLTASAKRRE